MTKEKALDSFWNSFGVKAYDENTVPDDVALPYITYEVSIGDYGYPVSLTASVWDRSISSWKAVSELANAVLQALSDGGKTIPYDDGVLWLKKANTPLQRMSDPDPTIRRIVLMLEAEFESEV